MTKTSDKFQRQLSANWHIQSSARVPQSGGEISTTSFQPQDWYPASVPATVMATLVQNGVYEDPYFGLNMKNIPHEPFEKPWWYRCQFDVTADEAAGTALLHFDGINYRANIWLNGQRIAAETDTFGAFRRFQFDVSGRLLAGKNVLAAEIIPPSPGDYSIGFVDWNPAPPDGNMGLFRPVTLRFNAGVSVENPFVRSRVDTETLDRAELTVSAELVNHTDSEVGGVLTGRIEEVVFQRTVLLKPKERKRVEFSPAEFPELVFKNPRLWWPNGLGEPNLYTLQLKFQTERCLSDFTETTFGIREVKDYVNEGGHRGFMVNGRKVLIKGGGWVDDLLLMDTPETLEAQILYVKHIHLNSIRLEGFWGKDHTLYELCDRHGILIMVGWSCYWEHEEYLGKPVHERFGGAMSPEDIDLLSRMWQDQVIWLRNHPGIYVWTVGSDKVPHPDLERRYIETFEKYDPTRPYLASTGGVGSEQHIIGDEEVVSDVSGPSRVKMLGPYAYTPPVYWYMDRRLGGAYGFNTETGPGPQVPPLESVKKMIPEDHLWPIDEVWEFHCGRNVFSTLDRYVNAMQKRCGRVDNVENFCRIAQVLNYELMRPMFEAFRANKGIATGIIQWMLNSAWPEMYWQLYDSYLMPNGAFYGAKKACEPRHLLYNYGDHSIYMINDEWRPAANLNAVIRLFDINSKEIFYQEVAVNVGPDSSTRILSLPQIDNLSTTYFLDLRLLDASGAEIDNNFYWLSTKADVLDYEAKLGDWQFYTPSKEFADFTLLRSLPKIEIRESHEFSFTDDKGRVRVTLSNPTDRIAFFIELNLAGKYSGRSIRPIFWDDNYISLLPGEQRGITAWFFRHDLQGDEPVLRVRGWNG